MAARHFLAGRSDERIKEAQVDIRGSKLATDAEPLAGAKGRNARASARAGGAPFFPSTKDKVKILTVSEFCWGALIGRTGRADGQDERTGRTGRNGTGHALFSTMFTIFH